MRTLHRAIVFVGRPPDISRMPAFTKPVTFGRQCHAARSPCCCSEIHISNGARACAEAFVLGFRAVVTILLVWRLRSPANIMSRGYAIRACIMSSRGSMCVFLVGSISSIGRELLLRSPTVNIAFSTTVLRAKHTVVVARSQKQSFFSFFSPCACAAAARTLSCRRKTGWKYWVPSVTGRRPVLTNVTVGLIYWHATARRKHELCFSLIHCLPIGRRPTERPHKPDSCTYVSRRRRPLATVICNFTKPNARVTYTRCVNYVHVNPVMAMPFRPLWSMT